ncbi:alpha-aminoadipic semialdehyde synthase [Canna indica]|uniref:Alpha-aminoadipic semialdehyde synthase n=1 Tax=Canna indica TaxID=4628 RepID=A0AAQ3KKD4_9LILI|nr:alpha-aminoadipic semialdehyde synthase [Canna indica]
MADAASDSGSPTLLGNGVVGILAESINIWERRAPLVPSHCARLLRSGKRQSGVDRIIVQPSTKRIYHDEQYEDVGCEISDDLSQCGLIIGIKQPKMEMILPDRAYAFFSHTHKAQRENMPLLDKILAERVSLFDYELIVGDSGNRLVAFGKFAGRAGLIDFLHGLGQRYLNLGYSTPFLSLGASHMYSSLAAAKAAVIAVGEEIATLGLPSRISPIVFVFTGNGNVSQGAQEIFKLLPHTFVDAHKLPEISELAKDHTRAGSKRRVFQVYGCVVTCEDMVAPKDPTKPFEKVDYYAHPDHYYPVFHEKIAPYASVIVNCMYWEKRFPRLLSTFQLQELMKKGCPLIGVSDITCDIGGSLEFVKQATSIERPFFRYDPFTDSYHDNMEGDGLICLAVDILPTEFSREASQHFGDVLSQFIGGLASTRNISELPLPLKKACITHNGALTPLYEYIPRMRKTIIDLSPPPSYDSSGKKYSTLVSLSGHLFDQFLINEALDVIEAAGGSFHLVRCDVGQSADSISYSELEVGADDAAILDQIIDSLTSVASQSHKNGTSNKPLSLKIGKVSESMVQDGNGPKRRTSVLILGAGRVCRPAVEFLATIGSTSSGNSFRSCLTIDSEELEDYNVIVASLYEKDAKETVEGIPNTTAIQLDAMNYEKLTECVSQVEVVISLLPPSFHANIAKACIEQKKHMVTASYVEATMSSLDEMAKSAGITILCEMGLDPGIDHMMAMKMINQAHVRGGKIKAFTSYCGGLPSPSAANNPLAYKFSWNPAGALRAGRNPATYKYCGDIIHVDGNELYDSAVRFRIPHLPAFALESLPNRNSLLYGDLYGISNEASTIFRATLRYEGFSEIMASLARIGLLESGHHFMLRESQRPTFSAFLNQLLHINNSTNNGPVGSIENEEEMIRRLIILGHCKDKATATKTVKTIRFLGLHEVEEIPAACSSAFDVVCLRMEARLAYTSKEKDMVLLHHEIEVEFPDGRPRENHSATLLEYGRIEDEKSTSAMALTVGIPAAVGALLLLLNKVQKRGVVRPLEPEVYVPALDILEASGIKLIEKSETSTK